MPWPRRCDSKRWEWGPWYRSVTSEGLARGFFFEEKVRKFVRGRCLWNPFQGVIQIVIVRGVSVLERGRNGLELSSYETVTWSCPLKARGQLSYGTTSFIMIVVKGWSSRPDHIDWIQGHYLSQELVAPWWICPAVSKVR